MEGVLEKAKTLGNAMARTPEYQALKQAIAEADDDRAIAEARSTLEKLEAEIETALRAGSEPADDIKEAYQLAVATLQANSVYQKLVAAQTNFDKIVQRVNQTIMKGIEEGAESRIILA